MAAFFRKHATTIAVSMVTAMVTAGAPAVARVVADYAKNADKVDGFHATGFTPVIAERAHRLVATNARGVLPNKIINKAPNSELLDGKDSSEFVGRCAEGSIRGSVLIKTAGLPLDQWTSQPENVQFAYNCAGRPVEAMINIEGVVIVRFVGNPAVVGTAAPWGIDKDNPLVAEVRSRIVSGPGEPRSVEWDVWTRKADVAFDHETDDFVLIVV